MPMSVSHALLTCQRYLRKHPTTVVALARHAFKRELAIPLDAIDWALSEALSGKAAPDQLDLISRDPALGVSAAFELMGNRLSASASIRVRELRADAGRLVLVVQLALVKAAADDPKSNVGKLLASGALKLDKPFDLLKFAGKRPKIIVGGSGDTFELDLLQVPDLGRNKVFRKALATLSPVVDIEDVRTEADWLVVQVRPRPGGIPAAARGALS